MRVTRSLLLFYLISLVVVFPVAGELLLRAMGRGPWRPAPVAIKVDPGGRFFASDPKLGYTHIPGTFRVTLPDGFSFTVNHLRDTHRITHPLASYGPGERKDEIWIFGCSFTHGWSLNDDETYPWNLQLALPRYEVVNFGTSGYGTLQSLIQLQEALAAGTRPRVVILAYGSFHDARNTFLRNRRKEVAPWNHLGPLVQPYARVDRDGALTYAMARVEYTEFPLMRHLAFAHAIEQIYDKYEDFLFDSHRVSKVLIERCSTTAREQGSRFVVAGIVGDAETRDMIDFCRQQGILATDISVDLTMKENNNLPHDPHPSAAANRIYAQRLETFLHAEALVDR